MGLGLGLRGSCWVKAERQVFSVSSCRARRWGLGDLVDLGGLDSTHISSLTTSVTLSKLFSLCGPQNPQV